MSGNPLDALALIEEPEWKAPPWPASCPEPGIYTGIPFAAYRSWPAINASALKYGYRLSARHMRACLDGKFEGDSEPRRLGRAVHCRLLEPAHFAERFAVATPCVELLKGGSRVRQPCGAQSKYRVDGVWYCGTHAKGHPEATEPGDYLSEKRAADIKRMAESVYAHKVVKLLRSHGGCEVSIVWEQDGLPAKARLDKLIHVDTCPLTIVDLKKCRVGAATDEDLQRSIRDYGWDIQAAWYVDGVQALFGYEQAHFAFVFIEDGEPFDVRPVFASLAMLEVGGIKARKAFGVYKRCLQTGDWPGYCSEIEELHPANWELSRYGIQPV